jgi:dipeptidyl aminopeptidase/acylaminoacyl peptidase
MTHDSSPDSFATEDAMNAKTLTRAGFILACPLVLPLFTLRADAPNSAGYQKPPKAVADILNAPPTPNVSLSPARDRLLLLHFDRYPPIRDLAEPMLRLAGLRINPRTNGPHPGPRFTGYTIQTLADGKQTKVQVPADGRLSGPNWSPDGRQFAFTNTTDDGIELWVADAQTGAARRLAGVRINAAYGDACEWMPDSRTLLCKIIPANRGAPPAAPKAPTGPVIQESSGKVSPVRTFQDLLENAHDETLFEYYCTSQPAFVDTQTGRVTPFGKPALYSSLQPAPDGEHLLVSCTRRPYSYLLPASAFPREVEVWDRTGKVVHKLASLPLADQVPIEGVPTGPRASHWRPTAPATLVWVEALDDGDPKKKVPHRDRVLMLKAPFTAAPTELARTEHRYAGLTWGETGGLALLRDYDRERRWSRTFLLTADQPDQPPRLIWDRSVQDRYNDPGTPVTRTLPTGHRVLWQDGDVLFLDGQGASPRGDRPFLDRLDLKTLQTKRLFHCADGCYEEVVALVAPDGSQFITRHESPTDPPNYFLRATDGTKKPLTQFPDPAPQLRGIKKQLVTYRRADGVPLSFTLYLPPGYPAGQRLPTVLWAYPREYNDPSTAGQVAGSPYRFTTISGPSHLFFLLQGYAVLDGATMPVVGPPDKANDTFIEQIVASAQAAIDKAVELGVTDRDRVGVGGHSYGAFMTANLLAHSDLFRAGIARSGAYNRTLTPFGFQNERRTLWEAPDVYAKMSPFLHAHKITEPLLLIHGEADNNPGTFPIQSERLYHAIRGHGGTVRYVVLPHESHGYAARESVEHTLYEMLAWFDKHVKHAPPRTERKN